jgi:L-threonate 2-dehydrogenase
MSPVGIIGLGNMGGGMARRLLSQGFALRVVDVDAAKTQALAAFVAPPAPSEASALQAPHALGAANAAVCACAADLPAQCALTFVVVVDAAQTREVLFGARGLVAGLPQTPCWAVAHTVVLCPTIAPIDTEAVAAELAAHGVHCIDAPLSGGPVRAQDGSMSLMVAAPNAVYEPHGGCLRRCRVKCLGSASAWATAPA